MFFFFSSRRRHTRCSRDWSSDVCSSDLIPGSSESLVPPKRVVGGHLGTGWSGKEQFFSGAARNVSARVCERARTAMAATGNQAAAREKPVDLRAAAQQAGTRKSGVDAAAACCAGGLLGW